MEPKKISQLTFKKEAVSNLTDNYLDLLLGGYGGYTTGNWGVTSIGNCGSQWTCCSQDGCDGVTREYDCCTGADVNTCGTTCESPCCTNGTVCQATTCNLTHQC